MKNYWKGKTYLKFEKGSPWYCKGYDRCIKKVLRIGDYCLAVRVNDSSKLKDKYMKKLLSVFDRYDDGILYHGSKKYYLNCILWILPIIDHIELTENEQVIHDTRNNSYIGYSHRGRCAYKIGDKKFQPEIDKKYLHYFYSQPKYRWRFIKRLLKYHIKGDVFGFEDLLEDDIIGHGISVIIPFRERGVETINTDNEAFESACRFADYIS